MKSLEAYKRIANHTARWDALEIKRNNFFAELHALNKDTQELLDAERRDPKLARAGEDKHLEILKQRQKNPSSGSSVHWLKCCG